jgi:hypothetical protein
MVSHHKFSGHKITEQIDITYFFFSIILPDASMSHIMKSNKTKFLDNKKIKQFM